MAQGPFSLPREFFSDPRTFLGLSPEESDPQTSRYVVLPAPYDSTASYKVGAREGPRAIIDASRELELYDHEMEWEPGRAGIYTLPELEPAMGGPAEMVERVYQVARAIVERGKTLALLGGEHTLTLGAVRACRGSYLDLSVLHLDAHADLRDTYMGSPVGHASVMRRVWELCPLVQAGVRSISREEHQFILEHRVPSFFYPQNPWGQSLFQSAIAHLSQHVYVTIDLDVLDPSEMPAVGNPEPGGPRWQELLAFLREVAAQRHIVSFDVMELCPREGPSFCSTAAARLVYKLIGYTALKGEQKR